MVLTLEDVNNTSNTPRPALGDFNNTNAVNVAGSINPETINTLASHGAVLSNNVETIYNSISSELKASGVSPSLDKVVQQYDAREYKASAEALRSILVDPNLTDQDKENAYTGFVNTQSDGNLYSKIIEAYTIAPSIGETPEDSKGRWNIFESLDRLDEFNSWQQQSINTIYNSLDPNFMDGVVSFTEMLVPFAESGQQLYLNEALTGFAPAGQGSIWERLAPFLFLGSNKQHMRDAIASLPMEKRREAAQRLMTVVRETKGSIYADVGSNQAIRNLQQMLVPGGLTAGDAFVDNVFSVLDSTMLLAPFKGIIRSAVLGREGVVKNTLRSTDNVVDGFKPEVDITSATASPSSPQLQVGFEKPLELEYKPTPVNYNTEIDDIISELPVTTTAKEAANVRDTLNQAVRGADGFSVEDVIRDTKVGDSMSAPQIEVLKTSLERIRTKRTKELNQLVQSDNFRNATTRGVDDAAVRVARTDVSPTSVSQAAVHTNPSRSRQMNAVLEKDTSGQSARIMYGTNKVDAISNNHLPEIRSENGRVATKTEFTNIDATPNRSVINQADQSQGRLELKPAEKKAMADKARADWKNALGITVRSKMSTVGDEISGGVNFDVVYGPKDTGYRDAIKGSNNVKFALSKYGITDDNIEILARQPDGIYQPVTKGQDLRNGNFLVRVKSNYRFSPNDVISWSEYDNKSLFRWNLWDIGLGRDEGWGGIFQQVIPKSAIIDTNMFMSSVVAGDKISAIKRGLDIMAKRIANSLKKVGEEQRALFNTYIRKANLESIKFNVGHLSSIGFEEETIKAAVNWKELQDTIWYFTNIDINRKLRARGYSYFEDSSTNTNMLVRQISRSDVDLKQRYYFADEGGNIRNLSRRELNELYDNSGTVAKLRRAEDFGEETIEYVVVRNTPQKGYLRQINDADTTLAYKDGYYHVRYDNPYYITKRFKDTNGKVHIRTIARARNIKDADVEIARLNDAAEDGITYDWKPDKYSTTNEKFDNELDVMFSSGQSNQKLRGERLRVVGSNVSVSDLEIETPFESLARSISATSSKVAYGDVIETAKQRFMAQFGDLVVITKKGKRFPTDLTAIKQGKSVSEYKNARNTWRWIESMENGYTNVLDDISKSFFNKISDLNSAKGWSFLDRPLRSAAKTNPTSVFRHTSFKLLLALNPVRQFVLQLAPALAIVSSTNPTFWVRGLNQYFLLRAAQRGIDVGRASRLLAKGDNALGIAPDLAREIVKDYKLSGMSSAVDAHAYLRDDFARLIDKNLVQKVGSTIDKPVRFAQKIGFNFGEQSLMDWVWLSNRDRIVRKLGRNKLTAAERDQLTAQTRAMTGDMNRGGDMPYNSNLFSIGLQYMQAVHKQTFAMILGHKGLTSADKWRLRAGYLATYGIGYDVLVNKIVGSLKIEDENVREVIAGGLISVAFNNTVQAMTGDNTKVAVGQSLNPITLEPFADLANGLMTGNLPELLSSAPSASLLANGGKIANFVKAITNVITAKDVENVDEWMQVALTFMQLSGGASNVFKARYMLETNRIVSNSGGIVDRDTTFMEAMMKTAGFETWDEIEYWAGNANIFDANSNLYDSVDNFLNDYMREAVREGGSIEDLNTVSGVLSEAMRVFNNNPQAMQIVSNKLSNRMRRNPEAFFGSIFRKVGLWSRSDVERTVQYLPEEDRAKIRDWYDYLNGDK